jgi:hypothetical protein
MAISEIGQNQAFIRSASQEPIADHKSQQIDTATVIAQSSNESAPKTSMQQDAVSINKPRANTDGLNSTAKSIRTSDTAMHHVNEYVAKMKAELNTIVKRYPPFPIDSSERAEYLKKYEQYRTEIDKLTLPVDDPGAQSIMAGTSGAPDTTANVNTPINSNGQTMAINKQEVHTGPTGLNIPTLPDKASDGEIQAAILSLDKAASTLTSKRAALASDAAAIIPGQKMSSDVPVLPEIGAEQKSVEVKTSLASEAGASVTDKKAQLLTFLG